MGMKRLEWSTKQEIADALKISKRTVDTWIATGKLPCTRIGRVIRIRQSDLEDFLERNHSGTPKGNGSSDSGSRN